MRAWLWIALAAVVLVFIGAGFFTLQQSAMAPPDFGVVEAPSVGELPDPSSEMPDGAEAPETEDLAEQEPAAPEPDFPDMAFGDEDFLAEAPAESAPPEPTFPQFGRPVDPVEEALRDQAWPARAAIEADEHMSYGERRQARLHIQRGEAAEIDELAPHTVFDRVVEMTSEVQATAEATRHLKVTPKSPEWQTIRTNVPTSWTWDVEAVEEGVGSLTFTLRQKVIVDERERIVAVREFPHTIDITIGATARAWRTASAVIDYVAARWTFFAGIGAALAGLLGWLGFQKPGLWPAGRATSAKSDNPDAQGRA